MSRPRSKNPRIEIANVRLTQKERSEIEKVSARMGFDSISGYVRFLHSKLGGTLPEEDGAKQEVGIPYPLPNIFFSTDLGSILHGDSLGLLHRQLSPNSVSLIMTSPPFGLVRKKSYGNTDASEYLDWFRPFAEGFRRVLKDAGSLVIDIGGSWNPGSPTRSLYHFELLIMLCREFGFYLCQEHYWWNPARLPSPAEWVNVRRVRVKDAVNCIWWLSKTPWPKASNRRVLVPYSDSMHDLLKNGYKAKLRPSGHDISEKFSKNNGGSVPPNLLAVANTESNGRYQDYCREHNLPIHPARYPAAIPEYFIRFLTDCEDLVIDPFAGSCVTGEVCERLGRKWICCELSEDYLKGSLARFDEKRSVQRNTSQSESNGRKPKSLPDMAGYTIFPPCSVAIDESAGPLPRDGGKQRPNHLRRCNSCPRLTKTDAKTA